MSRGSASVECRDDRAKGPQVGSSTLLSEGAAEPGPIHVPAHGKGYLRPFQPGQSGNPSGKGGLFHAAQRICREASPAAARKMVELMNSSDERVALMAADKVLERAWGKPKEKPEDAPDPEAAERAQQARAALHQWLDALAKPAPLVLEKVDEPQRPTSRSAFPADEWGK